MDQQTKHDVLNVRSEGAEPYAFASLCLSVVAILAIAAVLVGVVAAFVLSGQAIAWGLDETRSFYLSLRFDIPTKTKLSALAVTFVYAGLATATLVVAR